jgi:SAM-dependent methyltransferase
VSDDAAQAYEAFAEVYDDFNYLNDYEMWLGALLPELEKRGLRKGRVLDVGCGTGRAFEPLLRGGWEIHGCDVSAGMLSQARAKFGDAVPLDLADARELPRFGEFDLVLALNDVVNYLIDDGDLERGLTAMRANLAPGGLLLFDANTLDAFESSFSGGDSDLMSVRQWRWHGLAETVEPGGTYEARVSGGDLEPHIHRQRHHPVEHVQAVMTAAGLQCLAALGQQEMDDGILLTDPPDEARDYKVIYIGAAAKGC